VLGEALDAADDADAPLWTPAVNVEETDDELVLSADLPGLTVDEVNLEIENNVLSISGERRLSEESEMEERRYHLFERRFGPFNRTFTLPRTVDAERISARFDSGVLYVHLPKVQQAKGRKIAISATS
jgi:HSP20 family protein